MPAPHHLRLARQIFRRARNARRHRQAPLHHRRPRRLRADDSPRRDLHQRLDPPPGRQALASSAPPHLPQRRRRSRPLHLAGQGGPALAAALRIRTAGPADLPDSRVNRVENQGWSRSRRNEDRSVAELKEVTAREPRQERPQQERRGLLEPRPNGFEIPCSPISFAAPSSQPPPAASRSGSPYALPRSQGQQNSEAGMIRLQSGGLSLRR